MLKFDKTVDDLVERLKGNPHEQSREYIVVWVRRDGDVLYLYHSCIHDQEHIAPIYTLCRTSDGDEWSWKADSLAEFQSVLEGERFHIYDASINDIIFQTLTGG